MIGILGDDLAGLVAAYRLVREGYDVRVFTSSGPSIADSDDETEFVEPAGPSNGENSFDAPTLDHVHPADEHVSSLLDDLELDIDWCRGTDAYYVDGLVHPLDALSQLAAYPHLSLYAKATLATFGRKIGTDTNAERFGETDGFDSYDDVTVQEFLTEHATPEVYHGFVRPILVARFGERAETIGAAWLLERLRRDGTPGRRPNRGVIRGGTARVSSALRRKIGPENVITDARVVSIDTVAGAFDSVTVEVAGDVETHELGTVVVTDPSTIESLSGCERGVDVQGRIHVLLSVAEFPVDTARVTVAEDAPFDVLYDHTASDPSDRYDGEGLFSTVRYVQHPSKRCWQLTDRTIEQQTIAGLENLFPNFSAEHVLNVEVVREPRYGPIYERGYRDAIVPYRPDSAPEGCFYAGLAAPAQYPDRTLEGAVETGVTCADLIVESRPDQRDRTSLRATAERGENRNQQRE